MRKLAGVFFKDRLRGFGRGRVKQHDRGDVFAERFGDTRKLLGQHPHADAGMPRRKAEFHQLACPSFDAAQLSSTMRVLVPSK